MLYLWIYTAKNGQNKIENQYDHVDYIALL